MLYLFIRKKRKASLLCIFETTIQWLCLFGNIKSIFLLYLGFLDTLLKNGFHVFTVFARELVQYVSEVISLMHVIGNVAWQQVGLWLDVIMPL